MVLVTKKIHNNIRMSRQISAIKASVIKKLDELEKSGLLEIQTASQDSIYQMEREESELEKSVCTADFNVKWTCVMPSEMTWKSGDVFALLDAISSGMTLSHDR
jgi:hypothetical protein